ncbi:MAG: hypothetical protein JNK60_09330 [Acidobacteria bacterium]|nr:hypothetical protein [Acidobacteriota bacterium]
MTGTFSFETRYDVAFARRAFRATFRENAWALFAYSGFLAFVALLVGREVWWFTPFISGVLGLLWLLVVRSARTTAQAAKTMGEPVIRVELQPGAFTIVTPFASSTVLWHTVQAVRDLGDVVLVQGKDTPHPTPFDGNALGDAGRVVLKEAVRAAGGRWH